MDKSPTAAADPESPPAAGKYPFRLCHSFLLSPACGNCGDIGIPMPSVMQPKALFDWGYKDAHCANRKNRVCVKKSVDENPSPLFTGTTITSTIFFLWKRGSKRGRENPS